MPLSLPPTAVDHVVDMEQIGPLLYDILKGVASAPGEKVDDPLRDLTDTSKRSTNIDFRNYKSSTILRRIRPAYGGDTQRGTRDYADLLGRIRRK